MSKKKLSGVPRRKSGTNFRRLPKNKQKKEHRQGKGYKPNQKLLRGDPCKYDNYCPFDDE